MPVKSKNVKKAKCKYASPISNDRAEAFVGPKPKILPKFSEVPTERDRRAFELAAKGMNQREIAKKLKTSQPTVHRAIKKYRLWFGMTLPEDRGEMIGWARFRVAVEEQKIFLRHQQELAMEEWERSRQSVPMKRKRTKLDPEGQKLDGMPIKDIQIDEYVQPRHASAAHLNAAAKRSLELTMLEAGYLGVHKLTCDKVIDVDERDRWDRVVKNQEATIAKLTATITGLTERLAALEAKLAADRSRVHGAERNARVSDAASAVHQPQGNMDPACISQSLMHPTESSRVHGAERNARVSDAGSAVHQPQGNMDPACISQSLMHPTRDESGNVENTPAANQNSAVTEVVSPVQKAASGERPDSSPAAAKRPESDESRPPSPIRKPPTYVTVLGPGGHLIYLKKPEN